MVEEQCRLLQGRLQGLQEEDRRRPKTFIIIYYGFTCHLRNFIDYIILYYIDYYYY